MSDKDLAELFGKLGKASKSSDEEAEEDVEEDVSEEAVEPEDEAVDDETEPEPEETSMSRTVFVAGTTSKR